MSQPSYLVDPSSLTPHRRLADGDFATLNRLFGKVIINVGDIKTFFNVGDTDNGLTVDVFLSDMQFSGISFSDITFTHTTDTENNPSKYLDIELDATGE